MSLFQTRSDEALARFINTVGNPDTVAEGIAHVYAFLEEFGGLFTELVYVTIDAAMDQPGLTLNQRQAVACDVPIDARAELSTLVVEAFSEVAGHPNIDVAEAERVALQAFRVRLDLLFATAQMGGRS